METGFENVVITRNAERRSWLHNRKLLGLAAAAVLIFGTLLGSAATAKGWLPFVNARNSSEETKVPIYLSSNAQVNQQLTLNGGFSAIAKAVTPAVVTVNVSSRQRGTQSPFGFLDPFRDFFNQPDQPNQDDESTPRRRIIPNPQNRQQNPDRRGPLTPSGVGSGVIVSPDGYIITNNHVVEGADKVEVTLPDKREFIAKVVGSDPPTDVAIIKIEGAGFPTVSFGDSNQVEVGDIVLAVGNPLGIGQSVSMGIISAKGRQSRAGGDAFENFLQTDAAINRGNSGGALVNLKGELIGVPSQILSQSGGNIGIGFAIPTEMARTVMDQLIRKGKVTRGMLGINIRAFTQDEAEAFGFKNGTKGALVERVTPGLPADQAGVKRGDIVTEFQGQRIEDSTQLRNLAAQTAPGTTVKFKVWRDGAEKELSAKIVERDVDKVANTEAGGDKGEGNTAGGVLSGVRVEAVTPELAQRLRLPSTARGVVITDIEDDSNAAAAGLRRGDLIEEVARQPISNLSDFNAAMAKAGKKSVLLSVRSGENVRYVLVKAQE